MNRIILTLSLFAICFLFACQKEVTDEKPETIQEEPQQYFELYDMNEVGSRSSCDWEIIPAGSVDVLQQAIDDICDYGIIYLKAGTHTEHARITVNKPVKIIGENGAILKIESAPVAPWDTDFNMAARPSIHVVNAAGTLIQNLQIEPLNPDGHTGILVENSPYSAVMKCQLSHFQYGIIVVKSNLLTLMFNNISTSLAWSTGLVEEAYGIMMISGESCYLAQNEITNSFLGIWACDNWGTCDQNNLHDNLIGILLCNVPPFVIMPDGSFAGSPNPGTGWKIRNNKANNNLDAGILVIDGANNNHLSNNEAFDNGTYGIELAGESLRFGYLTPTSHNNTVEVGSFDNVLIKVCGDNNTVNGGGILVDTSVDICN